MMAEVSVEDRLIALEAEVREIKSRLEAASPEAVTPWWKRIVGVYRDDPEFEEAMRLGREYRESQRPKDRQNGA